MSSYRAIRKPQTGTGQSVRRILNLSRSGAPLSRLTAIHAVKVEDAGDGMAQLTVSEMLPRSVVDRVARLLREDDRSAAAD